MKFIKKYWLGILIFALLAYVFWDEYITPTLSQDQDAGVQAGLTAAGIGMASAAGM